MSTTEANTTSRDPNVGNVDFKLEVQIIPVSDIDRSKKFYEQLGWRLDADDAPLDGLRIVQFTPPGSGASVTFGAGLTTAAPGSAEAGLIVSEIEAAHDELTGRAIDISDIWHGPPFPAEARQPGPDPDRTSYGSFFSFNDPDGNTWLAQEVTTPLPGRIDATENGIRVHRRSRGRTSVRQDRPRRARETLGAVAPLPAVGPTRGLARPVRLPHGRRAGRDRPA
jgi:catechol 2,3-dioxygenase-like lactoylglutathione lyase family enzyme